MSLLFLLLYLHKLIHFVTREAAHVPSQLKNANPIISLLLQFTNF